MFLCSLMSFIKYHIFLILLECLKIKTNKYTDKMLVDGGFLLRHHPVVSHSKALLLDSFVVTLWPNKCIYHKYVLSILFLVSKMDTSNSRHVILSTLFLTGISWWATFYHTVISSFRVAFHHIKYAIIKSSWIAFWVYSFVYL